MRAFEDRPLVDRLTGIARRPRRARWECDGRKAVGESAGMGSAHRVREGHGIVTTDSPTARGRWVEGSGSRKAPGVGTVVIWPMTSAPQVDSPGRYGGATGR